MRQGVGAASRSAAFGGVLLALIEGAGIMLNKLLAQPQNMMMEDPGMQGMPGMPGMPGMQGMQGIQGMQGMQMGQMQNQAQMMSESQNQSTASSSSWFGGLFGKKNEEVKPGSGSKTEVLESFDAPPVPSFEYK
ncbi:unnamed protein product [Arabidopsis lyrata]|nr:unnamed protein product [Arabidopsis lyrata]